MKIAVSRWSLLKRIVNSSYARLTVLVPVIGWLLVVDDQAAAIIARLIGNGDIAHPSWKLYALHVGLSLFGIGVGLFYLLCPTAVRSSSDFTGFAETDQRTITSSQLEVYGKRLQQAGRALPYVASTPSLAFPQAGSEQGRDVWLRRNQDLILKTQFAYYEMSDEQWPLARGLVLLVLGAGGMLTFIPSLMTIGSSCRMLYVAMRS